MPRRPRRPLALFVAAVIVVSGCASPDPLTAPPAATTTSATSGATSPAPPGLAAKPTCPAVDLKAKPVTTWKNGLSTLDSARTSTYRLQMETAWPDGHMTTSRSVRVDEERQLAEYSASLGANGMQQGPVNEHITAIVDGDQAYLTFGSWTGSRAGKWMRMKGSSLDDAGIPFQVAAVDTVPDELTDFVPHKVTAPYGLPLIHGRVPAVAAVYALGLGHLLLQDPALTRSLTGHLGVVARLNNNGCLEYIEFVGKNSTIKGSSKDTPADELDALIRASTGRLFISSLGTPQTITVPDVDSLIDSERA